MPIIPFSKSEESGESLPGDKVLSFFLYTTDVRPSVEKEYPTKSDTDITKEIKKRWMAMSESQRQKYSSKASSVNFFQYVSK